MSSFALALDTSCRACGRVPALGFAAIDGARYCHAGPDPTCYQVADRVLAYADSRRDDSEEDAMREAIRNLYAFWQRPDGPKVDGGEHSEWVEALNSLVLCAAMDAGVYPWSPVVVTDPTPAVDREGTGR